MFPCSPKWSHSHVTITCWDRQNWYFYFHFIGLVHQILIDSFLYTWPYTGSWWYWEKGNTISILNLLTVWQETRIQQLTKLCAVNIMQVMGTKCYRCQEEGAELGVGQSKYHWLATKRQVLSQGLPAPRAVCGPPEAASPGPLLEMHNPKPYSRPTDSESAFYQDVQDTSLSAEGWGAWA